MISVLMPVYNSEKTIRNSIESILNQSYPNFEFIIINDGSTDKSEEIIKSYVDSRIIYLKNRENKGISFSLNKASAIAQGKYIVRMDADDISLPHRLKRQIDYMKKNPAIDILGTWAYSRKKGIMGLWDKMTNTQIGQIPNQMPINLYCLFNCPLIHPTIIGKRKIFTDNPYDINYKQTEDYQLWSRLAPKYKIAVLNEPLVICFFKLNSNSRKNNIEKLKELRKIVSHNWNTTDIKHIEKLSRNYNKPVSAKEIIKIRVALKSKLNQLMNREEISKKDSTLIYQFAEKSLNRKSSFLFMIKHNFKKILFPRKYYQLY